MWRRVFWREVTDVTKLNTKWRRALSFAQAIACALNCRPDEPHSRFRKEKKNLSVLIIEPWIFQLVVYGLGSSVSNNISKYTLAYDPYPRTGLQLCLATWRAGRSNVRAASCSNSFLPSTLIIYQFLIEWRRGLAFLSTGQKLSWSN